jgi:hypothetical protein
MYVTRDGNLASARVDKLWLAASGARAISDESWRDYLGHASTSVKSDGPYFGVLFWAPQNGPSAAQRKLLTEEFAQAIRIDLQRRVALISDSPLVRGAITAITWFTRSNVGAFAPKDAKKALDWLGEDIPFDRIAAQRALDEIIAKVHGGVRKNGTW